MLRTKLLVAFLGVLAPTLVMASLLYWVPRQIEQHVARSQIDRDQIQLFLEAAFQTTRELQWLSYHVALGEPVPKARVLAARRRLDGQLSALREATARDLARLDDDDGRTGGEEVERIDRFEQLANDWVAALTESEKISQTEFRARIDQLDRQLVALIDEVLKAETRESAEADSEARALTHGVALVGVAVAIIATVVTIGTALWARRRIQTPIEDLRQATLRLASDGLEHRLPVSGRDELAGLATSFNWMASELQRRRSELDQARAGLEQKVRQRTAELNESNLVLRRMDEARRRMFEDISHALRTPLTVIRGEAEVTLRAGRGPSRATRAALVRIAETAAQLGKLVEDLLMVSRSEALAPHAEMTTISANQLVHDLGEEARVLGAAKGLEVERSIPDRPVVIGGDRDRLHQALLIVVDNACRYTPSGGRVTIDLSADPTQMVLTVADSGIGIAKDELDFVTERFYRGSNVGELEPAGAGLGLHIAKSVIEGYGGELGIASKPGAGTKVTICLPLRQDGADERAAD